MPENKIEPPDWLDQEFIQNALQQGFQDISLKINKFTIEPATSIGDNYVSQIFRVEADLSTNSKNHERFRFLIKSLPKGQKMEDFVQECKFFQKESKMLSETLPKLHRYLKEAGLGHKLSARVYYKQGPPRDLIFLEDLCVKGYRVADRKVGLDLEHSVKVLESLATLHAGSLALIEEEPEIKYEYNEGFWSEENEKHMVKALEEGVVGLANEVEKWSGVPKDYPEKLRRMKSTILKKCFKSTKRDENRFNVLIHGDTWTNNYMFKYDNEGKVEKLKFVDFQLSAYKSPVIDLLYFIFSSPRAEIKLSRLDYFLEIYHNKLTEVCQALNLSKFNYTLEDLKEDFENKLFFAFVVSICVFPFTIVKEENVQDVNDLLDDNKDFDTTIYRSERYRNEFKSLLFYFVDKGIV